MTKSSISMKSCKKFAKTLGFCPENARLNCKTGTCVVVGKRCLGKIKYLPIKKTVKSPLVAELSFSSEQSNKGCVLNLGRIPVLQAELNDFIKQLIKNDVKISSVNTDWIKIKPQIVYVNIFSDDMHSHEFACAVRKSMENTCSKKLGKNILDTIVKVNKPKHKDCCKKKKACSSSSSSSCTSSSSTCPSSTSSCTSSSSDCCSSSSSSCSSSSSTSCSSSSSNDCCDSSSSSSCSSSSSSSCSSSSSSSCSSSSSSSCDSSSSSSCDSSEWYY